jgi:phage N-6-adenine-methyltransferase
MSALPFPSRLAECEAVIERGLATFVEVGNALLEIRDDRLYRETHRTFEDYCRERWAGTYFAHRQNVDAYIREASVGNEISLPNRAVARELVPLRAEPEQLREAWAESVERHGERPTAAQVREVVEEKRSGKLDVHFSSATDEWATPQDFFDAVHAEFRFELDVCALPTSAKCERYFAPEDDGLAQDWRGTCWMNPPYGDEIRHWVKKAHDSALDNDAVVACLVPARVDTGWWWDYCRHAEIRFLRGRLRFGDAGSGAPFPSALVVFGRPARVVWWEWQ